MQKAARLFNGILGLALALSLSLPSAYSQEVAKLKQQKSGFFSDVFDQNIFYEATNYLRLDRLYRALARKKVHAANVNIYDEVPDSNFFTNRQGRKPFSGADLEAGPSPADLPDTTGSLTILDGKFEGLFPRFSVRDSKGKNYQLTFDASDSLELSTGAQAIASRIYYAAGYNVPQYTIVNFAPNQLSPAEGSKMLDSSGFKKPITKERLDEYILFIPWDADGKFRASASKILDGPNAGVFSFEGRRKQDPDDKYPHEQLRELRALQVFSSWLNNTDIREGNTISLLEQENGRNVYKHYLLDFSSSLGSDKQNVKAAVGGYEYLIDVGETTKAFWALGFWEKPWQKRWQAAGEQTNPSVAIGYFDNNNFTPEKYKTQLPNYAFKDLTRADGFWAAKIMMSFSDEDLEAIVRSAKYTNPADAKYIAETLIARRNMIAKYWFDKAAALDYFDVKNNNLVFEDLRVKYGFQKQDAAAYHVDVTGKKGKHVEKLASLDVREPSIKIDSAWLNQYEAVDFSIRTDSDKDKKSKWSPYVVVTVNRQGVAGILHED